MSKHVEYRDYTIRSTPLPLLQNGEWKPEIVIAWERDGTVTALPFWDNTTYTTEEAADNHGIKLAQDIIDGKVPGLSVN